MKTQDETVVRRTLNLAATPPPPKRSPKPRVDGDELWPELDEPLPPPQPTAPGVSTAPLIAITCRVCGLTAKVAIGQPNLCHACTADLMMTRKHIEYTRETSAAALDRAAQTWLDTQAAADDATLARWHKAERFITSGREQDPAFRATWQRERDAETPLGTLLRAYEAYTTAEQAAREIRTWSERAETELDQAEQGESHD